MDASYKPRHIITEATRIEAMDKGHLIEDTKIPMYMYHKNGKTWEIQLIQMDQGKEAEHLPGIITDRICMPDNLPNHLLF